MADPSDPNPYAAPTSEMAAGAPGGRAPAGLRITAGAILLLNGLVNLVVGVGFVAAGAMWSGKDFASSSLMIGLFRLLSVGMSIAAAVFLFRHVRAGFVLLTGLLLVVTELAGLLVTSGISVFTILGLGTALLAFSSALSMLNREALARRAPGTVGP